MGAQLTFVVQDSALPENVVNALKNISEHLLFGGDEEAREVCLFGEYFPYALDQLGVLPRLEDFDALVSLFDPLLQDLRLEVRWHAWGRSFFALGDAHHLLLWLIARIFGHRLGPRDLLLLSGYLGEPVVGLACPCGRRLPQLESLLFWRDGNDDAVSLWVRLLKVSIAQV